MSIMFRFSVWYLRLAVVWLIPISQARTSPRIQAKPHHLPTVYGMEHFIQNNVVLFVSTRILPTFRLYLYLGLTLSFQFRTLVSIF